jgi:hypothetical protein
LLDDDDAALAQHRSECGKLGTAWLEALPTSTHRIEEETFINGLALMLGLPISAFEGAVCRCGAALSAATGAHHCDSCRRHEKTTRHNTFGRRYAESVLCALPPTGRSKITAGLPLTNQGVSLGFRTHTRADGVVEQHEVFADTTFRGLAGKSPAWEGHVDYNVCDPRAATYCERAAGQDLHAASESYARKERLYATPGLLRPNQEVFIVCVELYGGVAAKSWEQLSDWAKEFAPPPGPGRQRMVSALLSAWRLELSLGLLEARVGSMFAAQARLRAAALVEEGVSEEQQRQRLRVYDLCSRRSVLFDYAQRAREARGFRRAVSVI